MTALVLSISAFLAWGWLHYRASQRRRISTSELLAGMRKLGLGTKY